MTELRKAAENLLEGVEAAIKAGDWVVDGACDPDSAIVRLRQALAQPEQEPVAGMFEEKLPDQNPPPWVQEYKPKHEWVGLTDKEITKIGNLDWDSAYVGIWYDFAKAIEAKLKEKNCGGV